jgi:glycerol-3-phosphate dehydrogenase
MWPLRFVMPHAPASGRLDDPRRPVYDMLARRELLPASSGINLRCHARASR